MIKFSTFHAVHEYEFHEHISGGEKNFLQNQIVQQISYR